MKQVININFQGRVVPIEVTAFEILKKYTESLSRHFAAEEGKDEIINDIENRIGELFQARLKDGATCITDDDVNAIIKSMGRPEEFDEEVNAASFTSATGAGTDQETYTATGVRSKRLYRDLNDKVIGGVCSGLANYFGIDVVVVRVIFVILAFTGVSILPYIILWIAVPTSAATVIGSPRKKLYRDPDEKIIGGVCSGIANYFGINIWIPRILFLIPLLGIFSHWGNWGPDFGEGFSPAALIIYIILWLVIPEATTTAEKLEMKGEKVDMNSIKNSVMEEMKGVQEKAQKLGKEARMVAQERGRTMGSEIGGVAKRGSRSLGDIIVFLFKLFAYFIIGCIAISLIAALFGFGIAAIGLFPLKQFVLNDGWQNAFAWGTLLFFIATPIIGIITWIIRRIAKIKSNRRTMRLTFFSLWFIGLISFIGLLISLGREFKSSNSLNEENIALVNPAVEKLEVTTNAPGRRFYRKNWLRIQPFIDITGDTAYVKNVKVQIVRSTDSLFRVTMLKMVDGPDERTANRLASLMSFTAYQQDSSLMIDRGIPITRNNKFRNQQIVLTVYVPVGKRIRIDRTVGWSDNVRVGGPWRDDLDINDNLEIEYGWDTNTDYIMRADGLYTLTGEPADTWKHRNDDDDRRDWNQTDSTDNYRYDSTNIPMKVDSVKLQQQLEQLRRRDSLQREKDKIERELKQVTKADEKEDATAMLDNFPAYNPLIIMN